LHAKNDCIYFSKEHNCSVRYSTVQYGLVRFLCRFRTTFCASFRWCWPLDTRDVTPGDVVDIFCLLGRVLVVVFARVFIGKTTSNARHDVSRKDVSGCSAAFCRIANFVAIPQHLEQFRVDIFSACSMSNTKTKPASIEFYNRNKCGVDLLDSMARMHSTKSPMRRWPMAVWCNILDLAGVNAWILFSKETGRKISRWDFIHTLALDLINPEIERRRQVERPSAGPGCNVSRKRRNCAVRKGCKNNKTMETCRKCCKAMCGRCQTLICIDCADDSE